MCKADRPLGKPALSGEARSGSVQAQAGAVTVVENDLDFAESHLPNASAERLSDRFFSGPAGSQGIGASFASRQFL